MAAAGRLEVLSAHLGEDAGAGAAEATLRPEDAAFFAPEPSSTVAIGDAYDYIVVGGGSAGAVVAARLSEDKNVTVLLVEAGIEHNRLAVNMPGASFELQGTEVDWTFRTTPQKHLNNRVSFAPRGKLLGGCSSVNAMLYVRGNKEDYDSYAREGCDGWSYKDLLPYFKKSENCVADHVEKDYHGRGGPLTVSLAGDRGRRDTKLATAFVEAAAAAGFRRNTDYNGSDQYGAGLAQHTIKEGVRNSTAHAFLDPIRNQRPNLTIATQVHVTRVLLQGNTAIGIEFKRGSNVIADLRKKPFQTVHARREVVLSAGAINTPWILQHSGIGPREWLEPLGIPVVADLPVGKNLQDHLFVPHVFESLVATNVVDSGVIAGFERLRYLATWLATHGGVLSTPSLDAMVFADSKLRNDLNAPDVQIHFVAARLTSELLVDKMNFTTEFQTGKGHPAWGVSIMSTLLHPKSVGHVRITSSDPFAYPELDPNYLADSYDLDAIVEGMKMARKIAAAPPAKGIFGKELIDKTIKHAPASDDYLREFARRMAVTVYHEVGTCKMGAVNDPTTVVDARARVKGIKHLRVLDASVLPHLPSGNTNAPAIVVGEKGADLIKEDWRK